MKKEPSFPSEQAPIVSEKRHWQDIFDEEIEKVLEKPGVTLEDVGKVVFEKGILDRIAPLDPEEKRKRIEKRKEVWPGSRDDEELYWRIMYSAVSMIQPTKERYSMMSGGYAIPPIFSAYYAICRHGKDQEMFQGAKKGEEVLVLMGDIIERARDEIRKRGGKPHQELITEGLSGVYQGIPVSVSGYTPDGRVYLRPKDLKQIHELFDAGGPEISPHLLHPESFGISAREEPVVEYEIKGGAEAMKSFHLFRQFLSQRYLSVDVEELRDRFKKAVQPYARKKIVVRMTYTKARGPRFIVSELQS